MTKRMLLMVLAIVFVAILLVVFMYNKQQVEAPVTAVPVATVPDDSNVDVDYKNATYIIDGEKVLLKDGYAETDIVPGSASKKITRYFGNELSTDLDGDGDEDVAFILTQESGGSGTFFYVVAALNTEAGYVGSDGYLLGDRIAPQTTNMSQNPKQKYVVVFNYAVHGEEQGFSEQPMLGKSTYLKIVPETNQWAIVEPNFEGESAEPDL